MHLDEIIMRRIRSYCIGGILALFLTIAAYGLVVTDVLDQKAAAAIVLGLALLQFMVQSKFFLHIMPTRLRDARTASYLFVLVMIAIIVAGSLWIMANLNYNMGMSPEQMTEYMIKQNKKGF